MQKDKTILQEKESPFTDLAALTASAGYYYDVAKFDRLGPEWDTRLFRKDFRILSFSRIYLPVSGEGMGIMEDRQILFRPGHIYLIPPFANIQLKCTTHLEKYWIHFNVFVPGSELDLFNQIRCPLELPVEETSFYIQQIKILIRLQKGERYMKTQPRGLDKVEASCAMTQILLPFLRAGNTEPPSEDKYEKRLHAILYYVEQHLGEHLTLQHLSERFGLNSTYLSNYFAEKMGTPLIQYVNSKRVLKAIHALVNENTSVKEIASQLGYEDPLVFARLFKRRTGQTPAEYRKNAANNSHILIGGFIHQK